MIKNSQLIFIASNSKGDYLFDAMRSSYKRSIYIDASYRSVKKIDRIMKMMSTFKMSLRDSTKDPDIDLWLREKIQRKTITKIENDCGYGPGRNSILLWFPLFPITSLWKRYGSVSAITDVAMDDVYFEGFNIPPGKAREIRKKNWDLNFENCDYIFTLSKWAMEANKKLHSDHADKVISIGWGPNIMPPPRDKILSSYRKNRVICIGHDYYKKGVDIFNEVARRVMCGLADVQCVVVGRPDSNVDCAKLNSVTCLPPAAPEQISLMMRTSKVFMILSRFDAAGHATVEAMSHGLPVICSNVCGMPEPIVDGRTGYVVSTSNINDIVEKVCELLTDDEKLETFRRSAYEHAVENWQWKHVAGRIMNACGAR